jgi:hypothetical protein
LAELTDAEVEARIKARLTEIEPALADQWEAACEQVKVDPNFSFPKAINEIWRQAEVIKGRHA